MTERLAMGDHVLLEVADHIVTGTIVGIFSATDATPVEEWVIDVRLDTAKGQTIGVRLADIIEKTDQVLDGRQSHDEHTH